MEKIIAQKDLIPFCRYDGATIFGGMWLSTDEDKKIKVFVINANDTATLSRSLPYGTPVIPINNLSLLKKFADMYKHSDDDIKIRGYKSLKVESKWNNKYRPNLVGGSFPDLAGFLLYHVDINNDNEPEWVLVYPSEGSAGTSRIEAVYKSKSQVLKRIPFDEAITSHFNLGMSQWYLFTDDPLFTLQKEKVVFNFYNSRPAQVCSYVWENNKVTLVHGDLNYCIH